MHYVLQSHLLAVRGPSGHSNAASGGQALVSYGMVVGGPIENPAVEPTPTTRCSRDQPVRVLLLLLLLLLLLPA
jgi:hypothetical protein